MKLIVGAKQKFGIHLFHRDSTGRIIVITLKATRRA